MKKFFNNWKVVVFYGSLYAIFSTLLFTWLGMSSQQLYTTVAVTTGIFMLLANY